MDLSQYLVGVTRRWKVIVAAVIVAVAVGWFLSPQDEAGSTQTGTSYKATTYLLSSSGGVGLRDSSNLDTIAALATLSDVPQRVADAINYEGDPATLAAGIQVTPNDTTGFLTIAATAPTAARARLIADTFAQKLLDFLHDRTLDKATALRSQMHRLDRQIAQLNDEVSAGTSTATPTLGGGKGGGGAAGTTDAQSQLDNLQFQRQLLQQQLSQLSSDTGPNLAGLEIVRPATAAPVGAASDAGLQAPRSRTIRLLIAGAIGLLLGIALALLLERFDTRVRTKQSAEEAYGMPVLAVIPTMSRRRRGTLATEFSPRGPAPNAFRLLAAALRMGRQDGPAHAVAGNGKGGVPKAILVTSGEPREGTSTVAASVAAAFAEMGTRVIVACCDYRHPTLHATFHVDREPGLTEALEDGGVTIDAFLQDTSLDDVRVLAPGRAPGTTWGLFGSQAMRDVLSGLRARADVVVIDTAPALAASDWTQLLSLVDAVVVVARAGRTDAGSARRTAEVLQLLQAPVAGVVLNDVPRGLIRKAADRSWYRYPEPARQNVLPQHQPAAPATDAGRELVDHADYANGDSTRTDEGVGSLARPGGEG